EGAGRGIAAGSGSFGAAGACRGRREAERGLAASRYNYGPIDTPAPKPVPRFEPMEKPRAVRVQTEAPTASSMGAVEWFDYTISRDGKLTVTDRHGMNVGSTFVTPGSAIESYDSVARRLVTQLRAR